MKQKVCHTTAPTVDSAVTEITNTLGSTSYDAIIFCSSIQYDFEALSAALKDAYSGSEVIGCTTSGEISKDGYTTNGIVVTGLTCSGSRVKGVLLEGIDGVLYTQKDLLEDAMNSCGLRKNERDGFALALICALYNAEENVLAVLHSVLGPDFQLIGGSAGDDLKFEKTYVSYNGKVSSDGVALLLFRTNDRFTIYQENIYKSTGKVIHITDADVQKRIILSIDNQTPIKRYVQVCGCTESELKSNMDYQMLGRFYGDSMFVSSMQAFNSDGTITLYSRLLPGTTVEILETLDCVEVAKNTCQSVTQAVPNPGFVFMSSCIQRALRFKAANIDSAICDIYNNAFNKSFAGFTTYGEQMGRMHFNSTLVVLAVEG